MHRLLEIGFKKVGRWAQTSTGISPSLSEYHDRRNILYCFVIEGVVRYIGKTAQPLERRIYGYQNPGPTQSTNIRVHAKIRGLLAEGGRVDIYALPDPGTLHFGGFHLNLAAGLEDGLISTLNPLWNITGTTILEPTRKGEIMSFETYENKRNPHVTIHRVGCGHLRKHGGKDNYGSGKYAQHDTYDGAHLYSQRTGLPMKDCSACRPGE
jgi:hypothetical protein